MAEFVLGPNQTKWLEMLESGEYKQGRNYLIQKNGDGECAYCCLGLGCEMLGARVEFSDDPGGEIAWVTFNEEMDQMVMPGRAYKELGLRDINGQFRDNVRIDGAVNPAYGFKSIAEVNDTSGLDFKRIAAWIRANPEQLFLKAA